MAAPDIVLWLDMVQSGLESGATFANPFANLLWQVLRTAATDQ
ncbi:MAG: hypothetical protein ACYC97_07965 [Metallibacterium sp.]